jgi:hypothetical protein
MRQEPAVTVPEDDEDVPLAHREELDKRLATHLLNSEDLLSWEEVKAKVRQRQGRFSAPPL